MNRLLSTLPMIVLLAVPLFASIIGCGKLYTSANTPNVIVAEPIPSPSISAPTTSPGNTTDPTSTPQPVSAPPTTPDNVSILTDLQASEGWESWGQIAPTYADCESPCPGVTWSMLQGVKTPSLSGNATQANLGGTTPYSDVLFVNHLIGVASTQRLPDNDHTLIPTLNNFTYEADFYLPSAFASSTQAMEFDINMFPGNSVGMIWGTECRIRSGSEWDIWDNVAMKWVPTGFACNPIVDGWNHVTINVQRGPANTLIYKSIVLNGIISNIDKTYPPFAVPADWYGITVNYQMDGDEKQTAITTYLDNLSFKYW
ncbi:MAG: hypothetical protein ABI072_09010 [Edaphobacter sp.]